MADKSKEKKPKKDEESKEVKSEKGFWDIDPLQSLVDLVSGAVFDGPKNVAESVTKDEPGEKDDEESKGSQAPGIININLGGLFKPAKRKSGSAATPEEKGKASGEQKQGEGDGK